MTIGAPSRLGQLQDLVARAQAAAAGEDRDLLAGVDDVGGALQHLRLRRQRRRAGDSVGAVARRCCVSSASRPTLVHSWMSFGNVDVRDAARGQRGLDGLVDDVDDVGRPHDPLVVGGDVHEQLVEVDVLLVVRADQVVEGVAGDRQHRLAVALGVVEAVEQVDAARPGRGQADAQPAGVLGVAAGGERGGLLVPHLDEADLVLVRAQRLEDAVDAVAGEAEDRVHAPVDQPLDQQIGDGLRHRSLLCCPAARRARGTGGFGHWCWA